MIRDETQGSAPIKSAPLSASEIRPAGDGSSLQTRILALAVLGSLLLSALVSIPFMVERAIHRDQYVSRTELAAITLWELVLARAGVRLELVAERAEALLQETGPARVSTEDLRALIRPDEPGRVRIDLLDDSGALVMSSMEAARNVSLTDNLAILRAQRQSAPVVGVNKSPLGPGAGAVQTLRVHATLKSSRGGFVQVSASIDFVAEDFSAAFPGQFFVVDDTLSLKASNAPAQWNAIRETLQASAPRVGVVDVSGKSIEYGIVPIRDLGGYPIATLAISKEITQSVALSDLARGLSWMLALILLIFLMALLHASLRGALLPLSSVTRTVQALSRGERHVRIDTLRGTREITGIARSVEVFRQQAIELNRIEFRDAVDRQTERRLIEAEMSRLSEALDADAQNALQRELQARASNANEAGPGRANGSGSSLAQAFTLMSDRVQSQHQRLTQLLAERTADLATVKQALAEREQLHRLREELEIARSLQLANLPDRDQAIALLPRVELEAFTRPAREVGGDSYDFRMIDEHHLLVMVSDASGKGVAAAMFVLMSRILINTAAAILNEPARAMNTANDALSRDNDSMVFTTAFLGIIDVRTGIMRFCNAGHNPPLLRRVDGSVSRVTDGHGILLGVAAGFVYETAQTVIADGDTLLLYSDGITEAQDTHGALFGEEKLVHCLQTTGASGSAQITASLIEAVDKFAGSAEQFDDITTVALRLHAVVEAHAQSALVTAP